MGFIFIFQVFYFSIRKLKKHTKKRNLKDSCHMPAILEDGLSPTLHLPHRTDLEPRCLFCIVLSPPQHDDHFATSGRLTELHLPEKQPCCYTKT